MIIQSRKADFVRGKTIQKELVGNLLSIFRKECTKEYLVEWIMAHKATISKRKPGIIKATTKRKVSSPQF